MAFRTVFGLSGSSLALDISEAVLVWEIEARVPGVVADLECDP